MYEYILAVHLSLQKYFIFHGIFLPLVEEADYRG